MGAQVPGEREAIRKFICVHGHFYQPPRENPWLQAIEVQDSAAPYHDWNERIAAQCYVPNAHARFVDGKGRITRIASNYSLISFDFGPTLLSWLMQHKPEVHRALVDADVESRVRFGGHGSALAQCYNHVIMPPANGRDKRTQVRWGIRDFESRFGRRPEGMWLPECAADDESLDALAEHGISFTILSPDQAKRVRPLGAAEWQDVTGGRIDPSRPYLIRLSSGRMMTAFFYDAPISRGIAFERLLESGERLAKRLTEAFDPQREGPQLAHIATDGESYGHHHRFGEMALAYALQLLQNRPDLGLTTYAAYLEAAPPSHEADIHQPSAWSCPHGVDRWRTDCGCNSGGRPEWKQAWRKPLREALDWLRDQLAALYERRAAELLIDPWQARDDYIEVILDRSSDRVTQFLAAHARGPLGPADEVAILRLLEMQRHAMLMYTSCGWFFDEISGIETVQIMQYAARAMQLAASVASDALEPRFLERLEDAPSNIREYRNGRRVYEKLVSPAIVTRDMVAAHYAISSLFEAYPEQAPVYSYVVTRVDRRLCTAGNARLAVGRITITSTITRSVDAFCYGVLHLGDHNLTCGVRCTGGDDSEPPLAQMCEAFEHGDLPEVVRRMGRYFGDNPYSIKSLFRDEQRTVLNYVLEATRDEVHNTYRLLTDRYASLMRFLGSVGAPTLPSLQAAMRFVLNTELRRQFESGRPDMVRVRSLLAEAEAAKVALDGDELGYAAKRYLAALSDRFVKAPEDVALLTHFAEVGGIIRGLPFDVDLLKPQNDYYALQQTVRPTFASQAGQADQTAQHWLAEFANLGEVLGFAVEKPSEAVKAAGPPPATPVDDTC